jgi:hypothetical protein
MKLKKIVTTDIKICHPDQKPSQTDQYYQRLSNRLQDRFCSLGMVAEEHTGEVLHRGAILLTNYMEDIVADAGIWRTFSNLCQKLYGHPVPLYHEEEEYYADEPSLNAIRYLLWSVASDVSGDFVFSDANTLDMMAYAAYDILQEVFEEAPINEQLADDVSAQLEIATKGFDELRSVLMWIYNGCYLTTGSENQQLLIKHTEELLNLSERGQFPDMTPAMAFYYATTKSIFSYKIGPLALYPKDYLAVLMRTKGMEQQAEDVEKIEIMGMGIYKYERAKAGGGLFGKAPKTEQLRLTRTDGKEIEIEAEELNMSEEQLKKFDGFMASSFVFYQGGWHLNGILMPLPETAKKWKTLCEDDPANLKPGTETLTADKMLKLTNGQQIAYFADKEQLKDFLEEKLRFPRHMLSFVDEQGGEQPTLFIDTEEPKNCMQFFYGYSAYIADPDNPFYNKEKAREKAINLLWDAEAITTHALNYLLEHDFLPDIYDDEVLSTYSTHEEKRHDIDFLMRFYRREKY